jgi:hypothetical protein
LVTEQVPSSRRVGYGVGGKSVGHVVADLDKGLNLIKSEAAYWFQK